MGPRSDSPLVSITTRRRRLGEAALLGVEQAGERLGRVVALGAAGAAAGEDDRALPVNAEEHVVDHRLAEVVENDGGRVVAGAVQLPSQ